MSLEEAMEELVEAEDAGSGMEHQTSSEEIVVAAIDNAAGCEAAPGSTEAVVETASELVHAQTVHQAVVAAAREGGGGGGIQRRVVMVGNTCLLYTSPSPRDS